MKVAIGSDHAGYKLKEEIARFLESEHIEFRDFGPGSGQSVDYPDVGLRVSEAVASGEFDRGILICGVGVGMSIAANKVPGIRAALCGDTYSARMTREHNDSNVLVLGERVLGIGPAIEIAKVWLSTEFSGEERHIRRIDKISEIERKYCKGGS